LTEEKEMRKYRYSSYIYEYLADFAEEGVEGMTLLAGGGK
jgi:hypothetical protein